MRDQLGTFEYHEAIIERVAFVGFGKAAGDDARNAFELQRRGRLLTAGASTKVQFAHDDVAAWLESLAKEKGYTNPYFSSSTKAAIGSRPVVNFTSTVTVTKDAYSGRYSKPAGG